MVQSEITNELTNEQKESILIARHLIKLKPKLKQQKAKINDDQTIY